MPGRRLLSLAAARAFERSAAAEEEGEGTRTIRLGKTMMGKRRPDRMRTMRWGRFLEWQVIKKTRAFHHSGTVAVQSETRGWPMMMMAIMMRPKNRGHRRFIIIVIILIIVIIVIITIVIIILMIRIMFALIIYDSVSSPTRPSHARTCVRR